MAPTLFSKQLTLLLDRLGLTKYRLARLTGLSPAYIGFLASGARSPSVEALKKLAPVLHVELDELRAWVEASRLGEEGLAGLRRHLPAGEGPLDSAALLAALNRFAAQAAAGEADEAAQQALLTALREAAGLPGLALWRPTQGALQIAVQAGLPSEYVAIGNMRLKEQGLAPGERFPVVEAYMSGRRVSREHLLDSPRHGLHFYASTLAFDRLDALPLRRDGASVGALAAYLPRQADEAHAGLLPWLELAANLLALGPANG